MEVRLRNLTQRQIEVFEYIHGKLVAKDLAPTVQEIQQEFGFASPNAVQTHLTALEKKGFIRRLERQTRGLRLTNAGRNIGKMSPITGKTELNESTPRDKSAQHGEGANLASTLSLGSGSAAPVASLLDQRVSREERKILVVDDEDDIRLVEAIRLQRAGHTTVAAANGREALRCFYENRPDLVVLDIAMPEMDGWQVLKRIREVSNLPVLMLSASATEKDKIRGLNQGADDYITKPFSGDEILARVDAALRRATATSERYELPQASSHGENVNILPNATP
jgi:CheY-like chemotaxis protein